jgi:PEGA domain/Protein kinase domain
VLHQIGTGTLGPTCCAYDPQRDRVVAVKIFTLNLAPDRLRQLVAEFERLITADLGHPGIVAPVATGTVGTSPYLASEFIEAESFDAAIRKYGPAPPEAARRVITELAGCLDFAAAVDIQHGALHPADILILPNETRLTGLGVARALERAGVPLPIRNTYAAPERVRGFAWDRRADVYTLAALLHELMWGRRIAGSGTEAAAALTDVPEADMAALRMSFTRALADRPEDRFGSALEFVEAVGSAFTVRPAAGNGRAQEAAVRRRTPLDESALSAAAWDAISHAAPTAVKERTGLDLDLRKAEQARYADAEVAPAVRFDAARPTRPSSGAAGVQPGLPDAPPATRDSPIPLARTGSAAASARSRLIWPMAAILVIGIGLGFAVGYGFKGPRAPAPALDSDAPLPSATAVSAPKESPAPTATSGRDFTESVVQQPPAPAKSPAHGESRATPPAATAPAAFEGRLLVRSEPAGASVIVDGREYGTTPAIVRPLTRGTHRVRVIRDGYIPEERSVAVTRNQPAPSLLVTLEPRRPAAERVSQAGSPAPSLAGPYTGLLVVESLPPGASVYLDNKAVGRTPLTLSSVNAGEHVVRLERDGYHRWARSIRVVATERNRVTASLER